MTFAPYSYVDDDGQSALSAIPLIKAPPGSTGSESFSGPCVVPGLAATSEDESIGDQGFHHEIDADSLPKLDQVQSFTEDGSSTVPAKAPPYEVWRGTVLTDLQHVSLDPPFSTTSVPAFLIRNFDSPQYADCRLYVTYRGDRFEAEELLLHRVVIAQSPKLAALLASCEIDSNGMRLVRIEVLGSFVTPTTLRHALRTCYGDSAWDFIAFSNPQNPSVYKTEIEDAVSWMENALAFAAAGNVFQLGDVVSRGIQIASKILSWDNLERALTFAVEGVVDAVPDDYIDEGNVQLRRLDNSGALSPTSTLGQSYPNFSPSMTSLSPYTHGVAAYRLRQLCLRFISEHFPPNWQLNTFARPLQDLDRLPIRVESRSAPSTSRLSHIQFGSLPTEVPEDLSSLGTKISSIVLSVPYAFLQELLVQTQHSLSTETLTSIVLERERRRQKALRDRSIGYSQRVALLEAWAPVGWEEVVNTVGLDGSPQTTISRNWTGFRNPLDE